VGKTLAAPRRYSPQGKHPHAGGEDWLGAEWPRSSWETPPQVWGRLPTKRGRRIVGRNTPTGVGKTLGFTGVSGRHGPTSREKCLRMAQKRPRMAKPPLRRPIPQPGAFRGISGTFCAVQPYLARVPCKPPRPAVSHSSSPGRPYAAGRFFQLQKGRAGSAPC